MNSDHDQIDLFSPEDEPALLQPVPECTTVQFEDRIRSPTEDPVWPDGKTFGKFSLSSAQQENARSLLSKSRELVKNSKCFKP